MSPFLRSVPALLLMGMAFPAMAGEAIKKPVTSLAKRPAVSGKNAGKAVVPVQEDKKLGWRVSAGYQWRQLGSVQWQTGSLSAHVVLPWLAGTQSSHFIPAGIGNHQYDDGFVNMDAGTPGNGDTQFWGYSSSSQVDGTDLVFHSATGGGGNLSSSSTRSQSHPEWSDDLSGSGAVLTLESPDVFRRGVLGASIQLGYSFVSDDSEQLTHGAFSAWQRTTGHALGVVDRYDASAISIPDAPYAGSFEGPGPLLPNAPSSRTIVPGANNNGSASFSNTVRESFDLDLHTISLGPRFNADFHRVRVGLGLGLGLNVANWDADYDETLDVKLNNGSTKQLRHWHDHTSGTDVLPGFYLECTAQGRITERLSVFTTGRYDWAGSIDGDVGASHFTYELGGWTVMAGISFLF